MCFTTCFVLIVPYSLLLKNLPDDGPIIGPKHVGFIHICFVYHCGFWDAAGILDIVHYRRLKRRKVSDSGSVDIIRC